VRRSSGTSPAPPDAAGYAAAAPAAAAETGAPAFDYGQSIPAEWWALFRSDRLDAVLRQALAANHTLAAANFSLAQAREAIVAARSGYYPHVDFGAGFRRGASGFGAPSNLFSLGPTVSYSVDAFGETRRQVEQAGAIADLQNNELAAAYLTLTGSSVAEAITIAAARLEIATVEDIIKNDQKDLDLTQHAFEAGRVARTDVLVVEAELEQDRTLLPALHQQLNSARHALTVLVGQTPAQWTPPDFDMQEFTLPATLPVSLPSDLVRQRPDILAAEAELHADSAAIGVATAQMYPQITLSASLLQEAVALADLLKQASSLWSVGADADAPLFHGALAAQRRAAIDAYRAQLELYQDTVLQAFQQVADVLSALQEDAALVAAAERSLAIASESLRLQRSSYSSGKTSALQLIVAENTYSQALLSNARAQALRMQDSAQLFVALGGGWWNEGGLPPPLSPRPDPAPWRPRRDRAPGSSKRRETEKDVPKRPRRRPKRGKLLWSTGFFSHCTNE
jgi:NodT family efflux transporter outer membrane factor (OMF) lipoprotein